MFTKGYRSTSADVPKNLTTNVVSESLIAPRTTVNECSNPLHNFCKQKTSGQDPFAIPYLSVSELGKHISRLENKDIVCLDGVSNQLLKLSLPYIVDALTYVLNVCIQICFRFFSSFFLRLSLKKPKCFRFQNLRIKQIQLIIDQYHFCLLSKPLEKHVHLYLNDYLEKQQLLHPFQSGFRRKYSCNTALTRRTIHTGLSWDLFVLVCLLMTFYYTREKKNKKIVDCNMLAEDTTLHTSGKDIQQFRSNMEDSLDHVFSWCVNNHLVINPIKTKFDRWILSITQSLQGKTSCTP